MNEKSRLFTDLEMLGIPVGAELTFAKDGSQTCVVVAQYWPEVAFRGRADEPDTCDGADRLFSRRKRNGAVDVRGRNDLGTSNAI